MWLRFEVQFDRLDLTVRQASRNKVTLWQDQFTTLTLWNSGFALFRPIVFIRMHLANLRALSDSHSDR